MVKMVEESQTKSIVVALAGNPNVGKSTIFNALTGLKQHTGNWTGKTVDYASGYFETVKYSYELVDIPGTYSLTAHSAEEEVASDFIRSGLADAVVVVCDATCLERNLTLALQIMEVSSRVLLCINLLDEAQKKGITIDEKRIQEQLHIPVVSVTARDVKSLTKLSKGLDELMDTACCESNEKSKDCDFLAQSHITHMVQKAEVICKETVQYHVKNYHEKDRKIDHILTHRLFGYPLMAALLAMILWLTITGANYPSQMLANVLFWGQEQLTLLFAYLHAPIWLHDLLVLGVYRVTAWVVSVMLPPMAIFFPLFTILEDSGYLPRIAYNLDKPFQCCGACGKQALTMAMGFGCNAVGVTGCRIIDSPRERLVAILTNNFVPCNGRLPILITMLTIFAAGSWGIGSSIITALLLTGLVLFGIMMTFVVSKLLTQTVLRGVPSSFTLELPPYRRPQFGKVIARSVCDRTLFVLARAVSSAVPAGLLIWILTTVQFESRSLLEWGTMCLDPFAQIVGMDGAILLAFLLGIPANEIVLPLMLMIYMGQGSLVEVGVLAEIKQLLVSHGWTLSTAICVMLFSLMHWPCATTLLTIKKETNSIKWMAAAAAIPTAVGFFVCFLINQGFNIVLM